MKKSILFILTILTLASAFAQAEKPNPIVFITDASGSMWQKIGEEFKINLAREVLGELVADMPQEQAVGLVAYGHRQKGDCGDIETILETDNTDKKAFRQALVDLNPLGKTPLARSAKVVIDQLASSKQAATVILITDGIETCEGDLCQVVADAKAAGIDFVLHIVGFDLGEADRAPLECAAEAGGGMYLDADDKDQLSTALEQTSSQPVEVPPGRLSVLAKRNGELIDVALLAFKDGKKEEAEGIRTYERPQTNPALMKLPLGTYDIQATVVGQGGIPAQWIRNVQVTESVQELVFDFSSGFMELKVTENGALHDATVNVIPVGESRRVTGGRTYTGVKTNPMKKELAPGRYNVLIGSVRIKGDQNETTIENIEIKASETLQLDHNFLSGTLSIETRKGDQLCDGVVNIISLSQQKSVGGGRIYASANNNPKEFLLGPGSYKVEVRGIRKDGSPKTSFIIEIKAGQSHSKTVRF